jgi:vacuolar-type H+-ATPase subunit B/Vma2
VPVKVDGYTGLCMEIHDLVLSKYGAGREKDLLFTRALVKTGMLDKAVLITRLEDVEAVAAVNSLIRERVEADFKK